MTWEDYDDFYAYSETSEVSNYPKIHMKYRSIDKEFVDLWLEYMGLVGQKTTKVKDMNKFFYKCPRLAKSRLKRKIELRKNLIK